MHANQTSYSLKNHLFIRKKAYQSNELSASVTKMSSINRGYFFYSVDHGNVSVYSCLLAV